MIFGVLLVEVLGLAGQRHYESMKLLEDSEKIGYSTEENDRVEVARKDAGGFCRSTICFRCFGRICVLRLAGLGYDGPRSTRRAMSEINFLGSTVNQLVSTACSHPQ